jgi:hypothetical protein
VNKCIKQVHAFEKKNFVLRYLQSKRYTNFEFIVIQNLNIIQLLCLSLFKIQIHLDTCFKSIQATI